MKPLTQLLSGLLVASVALLNSGAVWSDTQANKSVAKSSATATQKKANKSSHKAPPVAKAPGSAARPATALNPHLPGAAVATATAAKPNPYLALTVPAAAPSPAASLALAKSLSLASVAAAAPAPAAAAPAAPSAPAASAPSAPVAVAPAAVVAQAPQKSLSAAMPAVNPYLANSVAFNQPYTPVSPSTGLGQVFSDLKLGLPSSDQSILPTVKKVQPTGEKPLYVLTFKCPTELVGIVPPPTKALHWLVTAGMDGLNSSDLLPFNMQQVCQ